MCTFNASFRCSYPILHNSGSFTLFPNSQHNIDAASTAASIEFSINAIAANRLAAISFEIFETFQYYYLNITITSNNMFVIVIIQRSLSNNAPPSIEQSFQTHCECTTFFRFIRSRKLYSHYFFSRATSFYFQSQLLTCLSAKTTPGGLL